MQHNPPKIKDVALVAGVSTATVSRALTHPDRLTEATRKKVFDAIRVTGYRVNRAARNLRTRRAGAILLLVPNLGNPFFSAILSSVNEVLAANGYSVLVFDSQQPGASAQAVADCLLNGSVDGVISLDGQMSEITLKALTDAGLHNSALFCCEWSEDISLPSIRSDNATGVQLAVAHLVGLGHRRIAHLSGPEGNILATIRKSTFLDACTTHDLSVAPEWILAGDFSLEAGARAAERFVDLADRPTAVFCASDAMALGFIARCRTLGLEVPRDLSVVGFDDIDIAAYANPGLSTIRQDRRGLGRMAAEALVARLREDHSAREVETILAPVTLIERHSTGKAPD